MKRLTLLWIGLISFSWAMAPTENAFGLIVKFRNASRKTYLERDRLHAQMGSRLVYRPKRSPFDFVLPKSNEQQHDFTLLNQLCDRYKSTAVVADCEINYNLYTRNETPPTLGQCAEPREPLLRSGSLSPYWAQELVGMDLVAFSKSKGDKIKAVLIDQKFPKPYLSKMEVSASFDAANSKADSMHGSLSLGLLSGPPPFSLNAPIEMVGIFEANHVADFLKIADKIDSLKTPPAVIQIGVSLGYQSEAARWAIKQMAEKSIVVAAAGNEWPNPLDENEKDFPGILVGSLSPEGYPSRFSQGLEAITISAPSDQYLQSTVDGKTPQAFGGTSGAAAMVASLVVAARALVPDLTTEQVKEALRKTALNPFNLDERHLGYASVNAVGFLEAVNRIRAWNLEGAKRNKGLRADPGHHLFDFRKEAKMLGATEVDCKQARRAFLLAPNAESAAKLSATLAGQGLMGNAAFYQNWSVPNRLAQDIESLDPATRISAARLAAWQGNVDFLLRAANPPKDSRAPASATLEPRALLEALAPEMPPASRDELMKRGQSLFGTKR